jgi:hypothetical protein
MNADDPSGTWAGAEPAALRRIPYALFAVPILLAHSRRTAGQNGASRGVPAPVALRVGCGAVQWRPGVAAWGAGCDGKGPVGGRGRVFCEIAQQPSCRVRPQGRIDTGRGGLGFCEIAQRPSRRVRHGRGARPGEGQAQVAAAVVLRNCATTLSPGTARAGARPGGRTGTGRGGRGFAKLRNNPPAGYGTGGGTTRRKDTHRSRRTWSCEIAQRPSRRVRHGRGAPGGRTGTGLGGRGFAKLRNDPPVGFGRGGGTTRRNDGHRSRRRWFLRNCATTLPPEAGSSGRSARAGFREMRNDPRVKRPRACPRVRCPEGVCDATVRHRPGGCYERAGSLGPRTLTRVAARPDLSRKARER